MAMVLHRVMATRRLLRQTGRRFRQWLILSAFPALAAVLRDLLAREALIAPASDALSRGTSPHPQEAHARRLNAWEPHAAPVRDCLVSLRMRKPVVFEKRCAR